MLAQAAALIALLSGLPETFELRYADLQEAVLRLPEAERARARLRVERSTAQERIDARRQALLERRQKLGEARFSAEAAALEAEIEKAERRLGELQDRLLAPLLARVDRARAQAESEGRKVVRLDAVPLIGWPAACDLTDWVARRASGERAPPIQEEPVCQARSFRVVDVDALAASSPTAEVAERSVELWRSREQAAIDRERAAVDALERAAKTDAKVRSEARRRRVALDRRVLETKEALEAKKRDAEDRVYGEVLGALEVAAARLQHVAVVEKATGSLPGRTEDGEAWARMVLGIPES